MNQRSSKLGGPTDEVGADTSPSRRPRPKAITRTHRPDSTSRGDQVVNRILELVRTGSLQPGDRLPPERELIEIFGIGRPGLREALRSLATLGVIDSRHGGGAYITDLNAQRLLAPLNLVLTLTPSTLTDSTECRRLIECEAVRKATLGMTPADRTELEEMMEAHANVVGDHIAFRILDSRFHAKIYAMSGNAMLERIAESLYNIGLAERRKVMSEPGQIERSTIDHQRIFLAIRSGDADAAVAAMEIHLDHIAETSRSLFAGTSGSP